MRLRFNLSCAFYLSSDFLKKFHRLKAAPCPPPSPDASRSGGERRVAAAEPRPPLVVEPRR